MVEVVEEAVVSVVVVVVVVVDAVCLDRRDFDGLKCWIGCFVVDDRSYL